MDQGDSGRRGQANGVSRATAEAAFEGHVARDGVQLVQRTLQVREDRSIGREAGAQLMLERL